MGQKPDGIAWTGFLTVCEDAGYVLLFRELNQSSEFALDLKPYGLSNGAVKVLGGYGTATVEKGVLKVNIPQKLDYIWVKFYRDDFVCDAASRSKLRIYF